MKTKRHNLRCPRTGRFIKAPPPRTYSSWSLDTALELGLLGLVTVAVVTAIIGIGTV